MSYTPTPDPRVDWMAEVIEWIGTSALPKDEKLKLLTETMRELAYWNRRIAENRGIGKDSELNPRPFPLRIPLYIKREIARGNTEVILSLLEEDSN